MKYIALLLALTATLLAQPETHPDSPKFGELNWEIPDGKQYRSTIGAIPFYYAQENLPLFSLRLSFKAGELYGQGTDGVGTLYQYALENGGTTEKSPAVLDSIFDLYAINLGISVANSETNITLSGLADQFPLAIDLLEELLAKPGFDEARLARDKSVIKEAIAHRFDNPAPIMKATWRKMIYPGTVVSDLLTEEQVDAVTKKELKSFHKTLLKESPVTVAFAGTIAKSDVEAAVLRLLPKKRTVAEPELIEPKVAPTHKLIVVQKPINQAYIIMGHPTFKRPDERYYPLTLFNEILGGGGFNSRLVATVRSDAGLTYSINSSIGSSYLYDGTFSTALFTKSESVNHAIALTQKTIAATVAEELSEAEIEEKKGSFVASLPSSFRTGSDIVATYQENEMMGRDIEHYRNYPQRLKEVTTEQVIKTARETIKVDDLYMVVVGDTTELFNAPAWEGYSLKDQKPLILTPEELIDFNAVTPSEKK